MSIITDLAALARAGFTPSTIKEILDAEQKKAEPTKQESDSSNKQDEPDYKKLYEESQAALEAKEKELNSVQVANTKQEVPAVLTVDEIVKDIAARI